MPSRTTRPPFGTTVATKETGKAVPTVFYSDDANGNQWGLWFDTSGVLRQAEPAVIEAAGFNFLTGGSPVAGVIGSASAGDAASIRIHAFSKAIPDAVATDVLTVTIPNGNHAAFVELSFLAYLSTGSDSYESARIAAGGIAVVRQAGSVGAVTASTPYGTGIATITSGVTLTLSAAMSAVSGAAAAVNTATLQVTLTRSGGTTTHTLFIVARVLNVNASGVTIAAA